MKLKLNILPSKRSYVRHKYLKTYSSDNVYVHLQTTLRAVKYNCSWTQRYQSFQLLEILNNFCSVSFVIIYLFVIILDMLKFLLTWTTLNHHTGHKRWSSQRRTDAETSETFMKRLKKIQTDKLHWCCQSDTWWWTHKLHHSHSFSLWLYLLHTQCLILL